LQSHIRRRRRVTTVEECTKADIGVGTAIVAGNQEEKKEFECP
jgi:hypothetical protein